MTSRARATALALVNWKGVFYERYQLDPRVTALEGPNGAGKTTVMIAAYVVLLPDMSRLRFTNLGETAATGGDRGIWGRLGEATRPSYAALELDLGDGTRVVAGVLLARKAEPTVELTPFLIRELPRAVRLQDLLLVSSGDEDAVPELPELRGNVSTARAKLEVFASAKDYFAALFELGVSPLRLASDEDRSRLADMLRTSMTGGISRALSAELRSFLLREQGSTHDTLARMRENLSACRRTRIEVGEAQLLEQEISGIYEAGQGMFAAALQAARERQCEHEDVAARLERELGRARQTLLESQHAASELERLESELGSKLKEQRQGLEKLREQSLLLGRAQTLRETRRALEDERQSALARVAAAQSNKARAAGEREAQKREREVAQQNQERAALGLANLQAGLDELHRRSSAYRQAQRTQGDVAALDGAAPSQAAPLRQRLEQVQELLLELDRQRLELQREQSLTQQRAAEWTAALGALETLSQSAEPAGAHERARAELRRLEALEQGLSELPVVRKQLTEQQRLAERQQAARDTARALGLPLEGGGSLQRIEACVASADADLSRHDEQQRALEDERRRVSAERGLLRERLAQSRAGAGKYRRLLERHARVESLAGPAAATREGLLRLRDGLTVERLELEQRLAHGVQARESLLHEANRLESSGAQFPAELLRLRDELEGEVLGNRFEELELPEAARLEALLGPLAQAIVVDDVTAALERLRTLPRELSEVRLLPAGTELDILSIPIQDGGDVRVPEGPALRVTRRPEQPRLGRKARLARIEALRREAAVSGQELEQLQTRVRSVTSALKELDRLLPDAGLLEQGDPAQLTSALEEKEQQLARDEQTLEQTLGELSARAGATRLETARYRKLLPEAYLLDAADHSEQAMALHEHLSALQRAEQELRERGEARRKLQSLLEALRVPPPRGEQLAQFAEAFEALTRERDRNFRLVEALQQLEKQLPALEWADAERALQSSERVAPALEEQHRAARAAVERAEQLVLAAEQQWEEAALALQHEEAALAAISAHGVRLADELAALGEGALAADAAASELEALALQAERLELEERDLVARRGAQAERVRQCGRDLAKIEAELKAVRDAAIPAARRWQELKAAAHAAGVLHSGESSEHATPPSAVELQAEARSRAELLRDRLAGARGGEALAAELSRFSLDEDASFLDIWLRVRDWLARRVPVQLGSVEDPLLALERLRGHLGLLEQRLAHQEADLRGASEDVARGIEVQLRRAKAQVRRLNQNLTGVSFGSVAGIRVELRRAPQMEPVLRALAEGSAQELLFQSSLPTEEALSEILRRYGGGRSGAGRVLDYREYLELLVEVQRKADDSWESANPTRLSTGEAIGVGAALMMVILAEWERDANLLRARQGPGSLRFLFLDEANRLSQDNLGSLFDLCSALDLQLLIAAPEVARSEGNTTYRLVRKVTEDGREEVIVSGRRALGLELPAVVAPATAPPLQGTLFES